MHLHQKKQQEVVYKKVETEEVIMSYEHMEALYKIKKQEERSKSRKRK